MSAISVAPDARLMKSAQNGVLESKLSINDNDSDGYMDDSKSDTADSLFSSQSDSSEKSLTSNVKRLTDFVNEAKKCIDPISLTIQVNDPHLIKTILNIKDNNKLMNLDFSRKWNFYLRFLHKSAKRNLCFGAKKSCGLELPVEKISIILLPSKQVKILVTYKSKVDCELIKKELEKINIKYNHTEKSYIFVQISNMTGKFYTMTDEEIEDYFCKQHNFIGRIQLNRRMDYYKQRKFTRGATAVCFTENLPSLVNVPHIDSKVNFKFSKVIRPEIRLCNYCKQVGHFYNQCPVKESKPNLETIRHCLECGHYHEVQYNHETLLKECKTMERTGIFCRLCEGTHLPHSCPKLKYKYDVKAFQNILDDVLKRQGKNNIFYNENDTKSKKVNVEQSYLNQRQQPNIEQKYNKEINNSNNLHSHLSWAQRTQGYQDINQLEQTNNQFVKEVKSEISILIEENKKLMVAYSKMQNDFVGQNNLIHQLTNELNQFRYLYVSQANLLHHTSPPNSQAAPPTMNNNNNLYPTTFNSGINFSSSNIPNNFTPTYQIPYTNGYISAALHQQQVPIMVPPMDNNSIPNSNNNNKTNSDNNNEDFNREDINNIKKRDPVQHITPAKSKGHKISPTDSNYYSSLKEIVNDDSTTSPHDIVNLTNNDETENNDDNSNKNVNKKSKPPSKNRAGSTKKKSSNNSKKDATHFSNTQ
jgi:hypothetical protein